MILTPALKQLVKTGLIITLFIALIFINNYIFIKFSLQRYFNQDLILLILLTAVPLLTLMIDMIFVFIPFPRLLPLNYQLSFLFAFLKNFTLSTVFILSLIFAVNRKILNFLPDDIQKYLLKIYDIIDNELTLITFFKDFFEKLVLN